MLTSLELFGFKSFADRTLFEFSPGMTCVVGPNGSGKSNVVDAIKWILGDQSPKSLRGKEMADVIFNGSSGRKPSGFAEATLTFDNSSGLIAHDAPEIRIGRRLYRSGDSEYLLNGTVVRLKDVKDLFLGTGAGTAAYSIIEQGRVDQILQANPTTRRIVFEEAAGISRYKARKVDAERKLEKVAQNLLRLTDIVDEVEAKLTATRSQASKAARFRELAQELQGLWTGLAADDFRVLDRERRRLESQDLGRQDALTAITGELAGLESGKSTLESQSAEVDESLRREERRVAAAREQIAARESTIRHQTARDQELSAEIERLRRDRVVLAAQANSVARELQDAARQLTEFEHRVTALHEALQQRDEQCSALQQSLRDRDAAAALLRQERDALAQRVANTERHAHRLGSQIESLDQTLTELTGQLARLDQQSQDARSELAARRQAADDIARRHHSALQAVDQARAARQRLLDEQAQLEQSLSQQRERRSTAVGRIHVLEDLEKRQEGISIGVRDILRRAHDSPHSPWNEILGSVSDLLQVALDKAPLVELALGARSQLVVVRRLAPFVDYLNRELAPISGRVGFIALRPQSTGDASPATPAAALTRLQGRPGVLCRADDLIEEIPEARGLASQLLSDTWIVDSLDAAVLLSAEHPGLRFVTRQGELLDADGAVYAGSIPHTTALVSRRSELRDLKHEVIRLDRSLERGGKRLEELTGELAAAVAACEAAESQAHIALQQSAEVRSRVEAQQREVDRLAADATRLEENRRGQAERRALLADELANAHLERAELQTQLQTLVTEIENADAEMRDLTGEVAALQDGLRAQQLELATHEERLKALRDVLGRLTADQQQRIARRQQADDRLREVQQALRDCRLTILRSRSELDLAFVRVEELGRTVVGLARQRSEVRGRLSQISRSEEELHRRRRAVLDERHQAEIRMRELQHNLAALEERMQEEYQKPIADFVQQGCSAFRALLAERHPLFEPAATVGDDPAHDLYTAAPLTFAEARPELEEQVNRLRRKIKLLGSVNTDALQELDELESRFTHLRAQLDDLQEAKTALEDIIRRINRESRRLFVDTFETIRTNFRELFRKVFGGGEGDIILEDPENVLECGIDIVARPPGKELRSITLLSGGEKTMTAVALLFAMFKSKPSPYCILDEVDAALDEANVDRYVGVVKEFATTTQFVVITHRKRTMTAANVLYGVTMEQAGISKRMSVRFEDVSDDGNFRAAA